jgi:hypothetical protein
MALLSSWRMGIYNCMGNGLDAMMRFGPFIIN